MACGVYAAFLTIMAGIGVGLSRLLRLDVAASRALTFSGATRNSLVVLPLALALPDAYRIAAVSLALDDPPPRFLPLCRGRVTGRFHVNAVIARATGPHDIDEPSRLQQFGDQVLEVVGAQVSDAPVGVGTGDGDEAIFD